MAGFFNNAHTAVVRRVKNIMTDERTHSIFERFLGLPVGPSPGGGGVVPAGRGAELAAHAHALPLADDADSDDEADILSDRSWPPRPPASSSPTSVSGASTGAAAAVADAVADVAAGPTTLSHGSSAGSPAVTADGNRAADAELQGLDDALPEGPAQLRKRDAQSGADAIPGGDAPRSTELAHGDAGHSLATEDNPFASTVTSGRTGGAANGAAQQDLLGGMANLSVNSTQADAGAVTPPGDVGDVADPLDPRAADDLLSGGHSSHADAPQVGAHGGGDPFVGFESNDSSNGGRGELWSDSALEQPALLL